MKMFSRGRSIAIPAVLFVSTALGEPATPTFTYQGQLKQNGAVMNGSVDLLISIWDSDTGGTELFAQQYDAVDMTNGLFSVQVAAPADVFTGQSRWMEIEVRYPSTTGDWTLLTPRELIASAPYAAFSLRDATWSKSGSAITNSNTGFVGINRDYAVGSEYFGVHAPVVSGYGGMYISTEGPTALPFYGYHTGSEVAWHYLDGEEGDWHLHLGGLDRFTVTEEGNVGIGNTNPQAPLHVGDSYTPTVSGSLARIAGVLATKGDIVSDGGSLLARSPAGIRAAVLQADSSNDSGGAAWSIVSHANSSPYQGQAGSLSFYNDAQNHFTINQAGQASLGTLSNYGRLTIGQANDNADDGLTIINSAVARSFRLWVDGSNICRMDSGGGTGLLAINAGGGDVGIATASPQAQLHVAAGTDVNSAGGGFLILGQTTDANIGIDSNEIMARDNGAVSTLHLQADGGTVAIGNSGDATLTMSDTVELVSSEGGSDGAQLVMRDAAGSANFEVDAEEGGGGGVVYLRNSLHNTTVEIDSDESDDPALRLFEETGGERIALKGNVSSAGWISTRGSNGNYNVVLTRENASSNHGWMDVSDANGTPQAGAYVNSSGNGVIFGDTKNFRVANPRDPESEIWYASLEGPEAAAYVRGTAELVNGRAVIALPDHFVDVCSHNSVTMHLTPRSSQSKGLAFVGITQDGAVVEELDGGSGSYAIDYLMMDVRAGHESYQVIRPRLSRAISPPADAPDEEDISETASADPTETERQGPAVAQRSTDDRLVELTERIALLERLLEPVDRTPTSNVTDR